MEAKEGGEEEYTGKGGKYVKHRFGEGGMHKITKAVLEGAREWVGGGANGVCMYTQTCIGGTLQARGEVFFTQLL